MSPEQRAQATHALAKGQRIRLEGVAVRRSVKAGERSILDVITNPPDCISSIPIKRVVTWQLGIGPVKSRAILVNIPGLYDLSTPIGRVSQQRREVVVERMRSGLRNGVTAVV